MKLSEAIEKGYQIPGVRQSKAVWYCKWDGPGHEICACPNMAAFIATHPEIWDDDDLTLYERLYRVEARSDMDIPFSRFIVGELENRGVEFTPFADFSSLFDLVRAIVILNDEHRKSWQDIVIKQMP